MTCVACEEFMKRLDIESTGFATIGDDAFSKQIEKHPHLFPYSDFSNGVSEGGNGLMCTDCMTFLDVHFSMYTEDITVVLNDKVPIFDIEQAARMWALLEEAENQETTLRKNGRQRFYLVSDLYVPIGFGDESFKALEIHQHFGKNHPVYSDFSSLHPSLEDAIRSCGSNDRYTETTFILAVELDGKHVTIHTHPNPYGDAKITLQTDLRILPEQLIYLDLLNESETPLPSVSLDACGNRDNAAYLTHIRNLQSLYEQMEDSAFERSVERKSTLIKNSVQIEI